MINYSVKNKIRSLCVCVLLLSSCADSEGAKSFAESFFSKVISNKYAEAAKMIDTRSPLFPDRIPIIKHLKRDRSMGKLNSTGGGLMAYSTETVSTLGYTKVSFPVKLNYDSTSVSVQIEVVDRGNGFKINKIEY